MYISAEARVATFSFFRWLPASGLVHGACGCRFASCRLHAAHAHQYALVGGALRSDYVKRLLHATRARKGARRAKCPGHRQSVQKKVSKAAEHLARNRVGAAKRPGGGILTIAAELVNFIGQVYSGTTPFGRSGTLIHCIAPVPKRLRRDSTVPGGVGGRVDDCCPRGGVCLSTCAYACFRVRTYRC